MQTETYESWHAPTPAREHFYANSLRMDLSRVNRDLEKATHANHRAVLQRAQEFLQGLFEKATRGR